MGVLQKKTVPIKINGQNVPNIVAKIQRTGLNKWKISNEQNEQDDELIIQAIERLLGRQITDYDEIMRKVNQSGNFVEYRIVFNEGNENENENNYQYRMNAQEELLKLFERRGGRKYKRTAKKHIKRRKTMRKRKY